MQQEKQGTTLTEFTFSGFVNYSPPFSENIISSVLHLSYFAYDFCDNKGFHQVLHFQECQPNLRNFLEGLPWRSSG